MKLASLQRGEQLQRMGVKILFNTPATPEKLAELAPDEVIIATGAHPIALRIPGAELGNVYSSFDVLEGKAKPAGKVAVIGGGLVGLEVAEYLAEADTANDITVLEMLEAAGRDLVPARRLCVDESIAAHGIKICVNTKVTEITADGVLTEKDGAAGKVDCSAVVVAVGSVPNDFSELKGYCEGAKIPYHVIGDAVKARKVLNSIKEGVDIAMSI